MIRIGKVTVKQFYPGRFTQRLVRENGSYVWACFRHEATGARLVNGSIVTGPYVYRRER